jgi:hypothetical protein
VARLLPGKAKKVSTSDFSAADLDEMLDLLAIAAYESAITADGKRVKWQITGPGQSAGLSPESIPTDPQAGWNLDRFTIQRKS